MKKRERNFTDLDEKEAKGNNEECPMGKGEIKRNPLWKL
jgi:hypothetical protein